MKIAVVTPYLPYPADTGGKIRTFYLLKGLAQDHSVDLFTVYYGTRPDFGEVLPKICGSIHAVPLCKDATNLSRLVRCFVDPLPRWVDHFHTLEAVQEIRRRLREGGYDLLVVDEICMAPYVEGMPSVKLVLRQKIDHLHYDEVNSTQPFGMEKVIGWLEVRKLRRFERRSMSGCRAAVCCSSEDASQVNLLNPEIPVTVIANGVDVKYFVPVEEHSGPPTLLYTGTMNYYPNIDAVNYFFREIHPHLIRLVPDVKVLIVGHNPPEEMLVWGQLAGVKITGSVPDIRPYLKQCTASIVPLRLGGGTRLKIMESIAAARPVVSTSVGAEGVGMRHEEHLLIGDDPVAFAEQTARLLHDRELRRQLIAKARPVVIENYSWDVLSARFEELCRRVAEKGKL